MNKIYCVNCKYLTRPPGGQFNCEHPNNTEVRSSWYESHRVLVRTLRNTPDMKNRYNDCNLYKPKSRWQSFKQWWDDLYVSEYSI